jgi:thymidylate kinase
MEGLNNEHNFVVLEGLPGSGKTTLSYFLSRKCGLFRIGEVVTPDFCSANYRDLGDLGHQFCLESDVRKYQIVKRKVSANQSCVMDRGFVSTLAYAYVYSLCFHDNLYEITERWIKAQEHIFVEPRAYIFLEIEPEQCNIRKEKREEGQDMWYSLDHLRTTCDFYEDFFADQDAPVIRINANVPIEEVKLAVSETLREWM